MTDWTQLGEAADPNSPRHAEALAAVLERYRPAMIEFLVRYRGFRAGGAEDIVQEFIVRRILVGRFLAKADRGRGRFRDFLRTSLRRFAESERSKRRHEIIVEPGGDPDEDDWFTQAFLRQVLAQALQRMAAECERDGQQRVWAYFWHRLARPILEECKPPSLDELRELMAPHELGDPDNARRTAIRAFERALRAVISEYPINDAEDEINDLLRRLQPPKR